jgi:hypothetical protein
MDIVIQSNITFQEINPKQPVSLSCGLRYAKQGSK